MLHFFNGAEFDGTRGGFLKDHKLHWALDLDNPKRGWKQLASNSLGRNHLGGAVHGDKIYAIGGQFFEDEGCSNQNLVEVYNSDTNKWKRVAPMPLGVGHISPSTISAKYGIIVVGGAVDKGGCHPPGKHRKQLLFYNPASNRWIDLYNGHNGASMVAGLIDDVIYAQHGTEMNKILVNWEKISSGGSSALQKDSAATGGDGNNSAPVLTAQGGIVIGAVLLAVVVSVVGIALWAHRRRRRREQADFAVADAEAILECDHLSVVDGSLADDQAAAVARYQQL